MDYLTSLRVYVRVVELGSFAAVAKEEAISATMVGKHIQGLESQLKAKLLHRTTRRHSITELGLRYFERAKGVLAELESLGRVADDMRKEPSGVIRLTAPVTFGARVLAPAVSEFLATYPAVKINLTLSDRVADIFEEGFELAFRIGPLEDEHVVARPLAPYKMTICAAPSYLGRCVPPQSPAELSAHNCLGFAPWSGRKQWRLMDKQGMAHVINVQGNLDINNGEGLRQAALAGAGIVMQPEILLGPDVDAGRLVRILPAYLPPSRPMHLVFLPDRQATPKLTRFIEFAISRFGRQA